MFDEALKNNGLVIYTDRNGTEMVCFGVFSLFCGGYVKNGNNTNVRTISNSDECYEFAQEYLERLIKRCKEKKIGKNGLKHRIGCTQRYLMTHEKVCGSIPEYF